MESLLTCINKMAVIAGLALGMVVAVHADAADFCTNNCAAALKECNKNADVMADDEGQGDPYPVSANMDLRNRMIGQQDMTASQLAAKRGHEEIRKRKLERYQACTDKNQACLKECQKKQTSSQNSVVLQY